MTKISRPLQAPKPLGGSKDCPECGRRISANKPLCAKCKTKYDAKTR